LFYIGFELRISVKETEQAVRGEYWA